MTATVPIATLQASIVFVILVVASLYASTPEDPIVPTLPDIDIDPPIDGGPGLGNNTSHPGDNLIPVVDAGGDVVTVKDGYGRNYLLPHGKGLRATKANLVRFETERARRQAESAQILVVNHSLLFSDLA